MPNWDLPNFAQLEDLANQPLDLEPNLSNDELLFEQKNQAQIIKSNLEDELQAKFEAGFAAGFADAKKQMQAQKQAEQQIKQENLQQKLQAKIKLVEEISEQLTQIMPPQMAQIEAAILEISRKIAQAVIGFELQSSSNQQRIIIKQALRQIADNCSKFNIRVNPLDLALLEELRPTLPAQISIISDENLQAGGCIIDAPNQLIDASIEQRLNQILAHLA